MTKELWQLLGLYLLAANLTAFCLMGRDKRRARKGAWRISEKTLFLAAVLGGALGGVLGMKVFRHKTRHPKFSVGLPVILAAQCAAAVMLRFL